MKNFISILEWVNEEERREKTFGAVMIDANMRDWEDIHTGGIDPDDVYVKPYDNSFGLEENPHITILYGIHEDEVDPDVIMSIIEENMEDVNVMISKISIFEMEEYDVVKYDIPLTKQILKYRKMFEDNFENTQDFSEYHPHMTIAYVKKNTGKKYESDLNEPFEVTFTKGVYSFHEENNEGEIETVRKEHVFNTPDEDEYVL